MEQLQEYSAISFTMSLFMVKKEVFEWIRNGQKTIELRRGKAKKVMMQSFNMEGTS